MVLAFVELVKFTLRDTTQAQLLEMAQAVAVQTSMSRRLESVAADAKARELRQLVETANAPIFGIDTDGKINEWNAETERITGFSKAETMGKPLVRTFIDADKQEAVQEVLGKALLGTQTVNYELSLTTKTGAVRHLLLNATTRRGVNGEITGVVGVAQDITDLKTLKQQVKQDEFLRELYKTMPGTIVMEVRNPGPGEQVVWVEGNTMGMLGKSHEEFMATGPFNTILADTSVDEARNVIRTMLREDHHLGITELKFWHTNLSEIWMTVDMNSRKMDNGNCLLVLHDITTAVNLRRVMKERDIQKALAERFQGATH